MNSLEFINQEIEDVKNVLESDADVFETLSIVKDYKSWLKDKLQTLQQIKTILEAWEIVKKDFILTWESPNDASGYYLKYFGDLEYETIKKALGIEKDE